MSIWIIVLLVMVLSFIVQQVLQSKFEKYGKIRTYGGLTGAQIAEKMLRDNGIYDVQVTSVPGTLTDHYNPQTKTVNLSAAVYSTNSIAAAAVAAHECGHAVQDAEGYIPLRFRNTLVPVANLGSRFSWLLIIAGLLFSALSLMKLGIFAFCAVVLFQLITLPVEFNASNRAMAALEGGGFMEHEELRQTGKVLKAAALTYVAAALTSILQLARLLLIFNRGNRR